MFQKLFKDKQEVVAHGVGLMVLPWLILFHAMLKDKRKNCLLSKCPLYSNFPQLIYLCVAGSALKNPPAKQETQEMQVWSLGQEDPLEEDMGTHSSVLGESHGLRSLTVYSP